MVKKRKSEIKSILNKYFQEFLSFLLSLLEEGTGDLIKKFSKFINFKKRLQRYVISMVMIVAALVVIIYGIGTLLGSFFPNWLPGISYILVGAVFILIGWMYRKYG